ncbi:hypothetical protein [Sphingobacterium chungjuense]|uniref:hypothetical protein n=1 Tax=Sphingobacterium chungjuense TaxID=2675553 RepID=UPI00140D3BF0|nr:hypothetical protein [Sphingobacterium chungjuense]
MKFRKFWVAYFGVKIFYLFFAFFVYGRITSLGDTSTYLNSGIVLGPNVLYSSTAMMVFFGGIFKKVFFLDVLASIPSMLLSLYGIYYAVERLFLYRYPILLFILLSLPNFAVWTSVHSKEAVGCFFSGVIAVMIVRFLNGNFRLHAIYFVALYLGMLFKPQYFLFILQVLVYLRLTGWLKLGSVGGFTFGAFVVFCNVFAIFFLRDTIDLLARGMYIHFTYDDPDLAQSTRSADAWLEPYGFFKVAPYGMFIAFWGPTISEMLAKPAQLIAGLESFFLVTLFLFLCYRRVLRFVKFGYFNPYLFFTLFIIIIGILFVHYPFGYLNPGSGIRYRANFYLLFLLLLFYLFDLVSVTNKVKVGKDLKLNI